MHAVRVLALQELRGNVGDDGDDDEGGDAGVAGGDQLGFGVIAVMAGPADVAR